MEVQNFYFDGLAERSFTFPFLYEHIYNAV